MLLKNLGKLKTIKLAASFKGLPQYYFSSSAMTQNSGSFVSGSSSPRFGKLSDAQSKSKFVIILDYYDTLSVRLSKLHFYSDNALCKFM